MKRRPFSSDPDLPFYLSDEFLFVLTIIFAALALAFVLVCVIEFIIY